MPTTEMIMLMTLSHCVVVKASSVFGSAAGVSTAGVVVKVCESAAVTGGASTASSAFVAASLAFLSCSFAMIASASANFFSAPLVPAEFSQRWLCQRRRVPIFSTCHRDS